MVGAHSSGRAMAGVRGMRSGSFKYMLSVGSSHLVGDISDCRMPDEGDAEQWVGVRVGLGLGLGRDGAPTDQDASQGVVAERHAQEAAAVVELRLTREERWQLQAVGQLLRRNCKDMAQMMLKHPMAAQHMPVLRTVVKILRRSSAYC